MRDLIKWMRDWKLGKQQRSSNSRFENKFKGPGGLSGSHSYNPILNNDSKFPVDDDLDVLVSLNQINSLNINL